MIDGPHLCEIDQTGESQAAPVAEEWEVMASAPWLRFSLYHPISADDLNNAVTRHSPVT